MKKFNFRKILSLALAAFVAFGMLGVGTLGVNAESENWIIEPRDNVWIGAPQWYYYVNAYDTIGDKSADAITKVTSSNTSILSIKTEAVEGAADYFLIGKAPGTAKLTVTFKTDSEQTKTLSKNIVVKAYPKQIKSLKVNGKKVKTSKYKYEYSKKLSKSKTSVKIKMALKNGWKINNIYAYRYKKNEDGKQFKLSKSALKKGKSIKFSKKYYAMTIYIEMKKGNDSIGYEFYFYRK